MNQLSLYTVKDLKNISELPRHISFEQKNLLKNAITKYYEDKGKITEQRRYLIERDKLMVEFL